jgi:radical SAM protein with 4Fe4S-binding SPASM domain
MRLRRLRLRLCRGWALNQRWLTIPSRGVYAYTLEQDGGSTRAHLRVEQEGQGLLLINANRSIHLNPTALYLTWLMLEGCDRKDAARCLRKKFRVPARAARADVDQTFDQLEGVLAPEGACPVHDLAFDIVAPFSQTPSAPYRMDLALTYRCNDNCPHCYNARPRDFAELDTQRWIGILNQLWEIGVPHICFTGGEATLRNDLPELVKHAEGLGQITGLLSNGRRLHDAGYVAELVEAGLDHVQITLESSFEATHDRMVAAPGAWRQTTRGIRNVLEAGLYVMTNTTLLQENAAEIGCTLDYLAEIGVPTVGINALIYAGKGASVGTGLPEAELAPLLEIVREKTERNGQRLIWYTPTQYCHFDPVQMELGVKGCTAAAYNMCVEPNGAVLPCQSYYQPVGNMLTDSWDSIWNHDLSRWLREKKYVPDACSDCAVLAECGGGCPLTLDQVTAQSQPQPVQLIQFDTADSGG